jgi:hypothetical protein
MSFCVLTSGLSESCGEYSMAGLNTLFLANEDDVTITIDGTTKEITAVTMASGKTFFEFTPAENTAFFNQELQNANGNTFYNQEITFNVTTTTQADIEVIKQLDFARVVAIVKSRNGVNYFFGEDNYLKRTAGNINSGTAAADASGTVITLTGGGPGPYRVIAASVDIDALL